MPLSLRRLLSLSQTPAPAVRLPTSGPRPSALTPAAKVSPSEYVYSSTSTTRWPRNVFCMFGDGATPGGAQKAHALRSSFSMIQLSMLPPLLRRTSMISPSRFTLA
ncbi:conserved hypothetical protein [Ricinus communis]|uniref:Uncharacterized protein n=1 Tax=Ricinus communis TaxID=3988 RepID=B9T9U9_RICCO|nr:conserved hypothetical protein [Ricinus communis]